MEVPIMPYVEVRSVEEFKCNMQLLLHNKYLHEGIPLHEISPLYCRFFGTIVTASTIDPQLGEHDWETLFTKNIKLRTVFRVHKPKNLPLPPSLYLKKASYLSEGDMKTLAKLANFEVFNAHSHDKLMRFVTLKYGELSSNEKLGFKNSILQFLNLNPTQRSNFERPPPEMNPTVQLAQASSNDLPPGILAPFSSIAHPIAAEIPVTVNSGGIPIDSNNFIENLFLEVDNDRNRSDSVNPPRLPEPMSPSGFNGNAKKRRNKMPVQFALASKGVPTKKFRPTTVQGPEILNQSTESTAENSAQVPNSAPDTNQSNIVLVADANVNFSASNDTPIDTNMVDDTTPAIVPDENVNTIMSGTVQETSLATPETVESTDLNNGQGQSQGSTVSRSTCQITNRICDIAINTVASEYSEDTDGKLNPLDWVMFIFWKEQGYYKGREKNCNAKSLDLETKTWKLNGLQTLKLKLPNKMIVFGELVTENQETIFEIIDCLTDSDSNILTDRPFKDRYDKAEEMISQIANCNENIPVRMKPYITMDESLSLSNLPSLIRQTDRNGNGTVVLKHIGTYDFTHPRIIRFDEHSQLEPLLRPIFAVPLPVNDESGQIITEDVPTIALSLAENNVADPLVLVSNPTENANGDDAIEMDANSENAGNGIDLLKKEEAEVKTENWVECKSVAAPTVATMIANLMSQIDVPQRWTPTSHSSSTAHSCNIKCVEVDARYSTIQTNPFAYCKAYGWKRVISGEKVVYIAPCKKVLETYKEVMNFLLRTDFSLQTQPPITIDYFSFENKIRDWVEFPVLSSSVINWDVSNTLEALPITCVNEIDTVQLPSFTYTRSSPSGSGVNFPLFDTGNECTCTGDCQSNLCACTTETTRRHIKGFVKSLYKAKYQGYDFKRLFSCLPRGIYECNYRCGCGGSDDKGIFCGNRVIQCHLKWRLQVFRKPDGWGLRTLHDIPEGHFVCQFIGKIVFEEEAATGESKYQIKLESNDCPFKHCTHKLGDETGSRSNSTPGRRTRGRHCCLPNNLGGRNLFIDATNEGNVGRFINHSSKYNIFMQNVFIDTRSETRPHIGFFAKQNIFAGEELTANFSTVRSGITETVNEKQNLNEKLSQRPGPKQSTSTINQGSGPSSRISAENKQGSSTTGSRRRLFSGNKQSSLANKCASENSDESSQGSSRSMKPYIPIPQPYVKLKNIEDVDQVLMEHNLTRSQSKLPVSQSIEEQHTTATALANKTATNLNIVIKQEQQEVSQSFGEIVSVGTIGKEAKYCLETCIKQEVVKVELLDIKIEKADDEDGAPFPHLSRPEDLNIEIIPRSPDVVNLDGPEEIDLTSNTDNSEEIVATPETPEIVQTPAPIHSILAQKASRCESVSPSKSAKSSSSETSTPEKPKTPRSKSPKPSTSKASPFRLLSDIGLEHTVKNCMKFCCIYNASDLPAVVHKNKLYRSFLFGFQRKIELGQVFYELPCGKEFRCDQQIFEFLLEAKIPDLAVDNFCFNPQINTPTMWLKELPINSSTTIFAEDISNGQEVVPIRLVSSDYKLEAPNFRYIAKYEFSEEFNFSLQCVPLPPDNCVCGCTDGCINPKICICLMRTAMRNVTSPFEADEMYGYRYRKLLQPEKKGIFECNAMCNCFSNCANRAAQNDVAWNLEVFNTQNTGWGVRTLQDIPKGAFVCNFVGMVKAKSERNTGNKQYQVLVKLSGSKRESIIDATNEGNLARFINHSCDPNLFVQNIFLPNPNMILVPVIAFFANRDIVATSELTFNYSHTIEDKENRLTACFCGSTICKENFL